MLVEQNGNIRQDGITLMQDWVCTQEGLLTLYCEWSGQQDEKSLKEKVDFLQHLERAIEAEGAVRVGLSVVDSAIDEDSRENIANMHKLAGGLGRAAIFMGEKTVFTGYTRLSGSFLVYNSTITGGGDSEISGSNFITDSTIAGSVVANSYVTNSGVLKSELKDSTVVNSKIYDTGLQGFLENVDGTSGGMTIYGAVVNSYMASYGGSKPRILLTPKDRVED